MAHELTAHLVFCGENRTLRCEYELGERFRDRVYTAREVAYCESRGRPRYQSYAARFAAKEATMKALGTGWNRNVGWSEIEVVRERGKAPTIALSGKAAAFAQRKQITRFHLSITHTAAQAIAHVIAEFSVEEGQPNP